MLKQIKEEALGQVTSVFWRVPTLPYKPLQWIPVEIAQLANCLLRTGRLTLRRKQHHTPPSRMKSVNAADWPQALQSLYSPFQIGLQTHPFHHSVLLDQALGWARLQLYERAIHFAPKCNSKVTPELATLPKSEFMFERTANIDEFAPDVFWHSITVRQREVT